MCAAAEASLALLYGHMCCCCTAAPAAVRYLLLYRCCCTAAAAAAVPPVLQGGSVASLIKKHGALDENIVRIYTRQLLQGA